MLLACSSGPKTFSVRSTALSPEFYTEIVESQNPTAITLVRSALEQVFYLENVPISLSTDVPAYWRAADDIFDLLRRSQECLARKAG
jgi:hypothetical protein